jgi:hypothetical protein
MVVIGSIAAVLLVTTAMALADGRPLATTLSGAEEVTTPPGGPAPGDPNGTGTAELTLNAGMEEVCYELTWANLDGTVQRAHIHEAPAGVNGGITVSLFEGESFAGTGSASGCDLGDATRDEIRRILNDPSGFYVNIHDTVRPAGAIRGQLDR